MRTNQRARTRKDQRKWARRSEAGKLRHLFMACIAINFRRAIMEWVANEIVEEERKILYGTGKGVPLGLLHS